MKPHIWVFLEMTMSQSKIGIIKKKLPGGVRQRDLSKHAKKGHGLKTVVSDFLPEVRAQSVRFTLGLVFFW